MTPAPALIAVTVVTGATSSRARRSCRRRGANATCARRISAVASGAGAASPARRRHVAQQVKMTIMISRRLRRLCLRQAPRVHVRAATKAANLNGGTFAQTTLCRRRRFVECVGSRVGGGSGFECFPFEFAFTRVFARRLLSLRALAAALPGGGGGGYSLACCAANWPLVARSDSFSNSARSSARTNANECISRSSNEIIASCQGRRCQKLADC